MRKRKLLAVLLSTVLLTQTVIYAAAEQETGNAGETEQTQEFEQKSMDGEMTEAEDPAGGLTGGYLPSDLDYNTPVYYRKQQGQAGGSGNSGFLSVGCQCTPEHLSGGSGSESIRDMLGIFNHGTGGV